MRFRIIFRTGIGSAHYTAWKPIDFEPSYPPALLELQRPERGLLDDQGVWHGQIQQARVEFQK